MTVEKCDTWMKPGWEAGILLARVSDSDSEKETGPEIGVRIVECYDGGEGEIKILNAEFFEEESVVVVYRVKSGESK